MSTKIVITISAIGFLFFLGLFSFQSPTHNSGIAHLSTSPVAISNVPKCHDHDASKWHPAVQKDASGQIICAYGHEHGDGPPAWIAEAGFKDGFDKMSGFLGNTSELENTVKHVGMKGFEASIKDVQIYVRVHLSSNYLDRTSRFHSYEMFAKDASGNVSHFQGWLNSGDPVLDRIPYQDQSLGEAGRDPGRRPIVWAATRQACEIDKTWCIELWTMTTSAWGPKISWGINDATTFLQPEEKNSPPPPNLPLMSYGEEPATTWDKSGKLGVDRSLSVTFFPTPGLTGEIWATQFGEIVSGPLDAKCQQNTVRFGVVYKSICLENYISPTLQVIEGTGNTVQKVFDSTGVEMPN